MKKFLAIAILLIAFSCNNENFYYNSECAFDDVMQSRLCTPENTIAECHGSKNIGWNDAKNGYDGMVVYTCKPNTTITYIIKTDEKCYNSPNGDGSFLPMFALNGGCAADIAVSEKAGYKMP